MRKRLLLLAIIALLGTQSGTAQSRVRGIMGQKAPAWTVEAWFNLPEGVERIDVADFEGKVVYLFGFQSWCPGCHSHGFPTLKKVMEKYKNSEDVVFVAVQTTFEGFSTNTWEAALKTVEEFDLDIPVAHDGSNGKRSRLMQAYRTGGTPWSVVIDRNGVVRFNDFHITPDKAGALIDRLLAEKLEESVG